MHSIVVTIHDNDFHNTFINLLDTIYRVIDEKGGTSEDQFTEEQIIYLIKLGLRFHYIAFQNRFRYNSGGTTRETEEEFYKTELYLSRVKVMFDEKADAYYQGGEQNGEAWYLHIPSGMITQF